MGVRFYVLFDYTNTPPPTLVWIIDVPLYNNFTNTTTKMAKLYGIDESLKFQSSCIKQDCHERYYPYFYSNG